MQAIPVVSDPMICEGNLLYCGVLNLEPRTLNLQFLHPIESTRQKKREIARAK